MWYIEGFTSTEMGKFPGFLKFGSLFDYMEETNSQLRNLVSRCYNIKSSF